MPGLAEGGCYSAQKLKRFNLMYRGSGSRTNSAFDFNGPGQGSARQNRAGLQGACRLVESPCIANCSYKEFLHFTTSQYYQKWTGNSENCTFRSRRLEA